MADQKQYYNSVDWGILEDDLFNQRSTSAYHLNRMKLNTTWSISLNSKQFYSELDKIDTLFKTTEKPFIVIFDPASSSVKRCSVPGKVTSLKQVMDYIEENNLDLRNYKITFIERLFEIPESFCGVVMTDGEGNTTIEILLCSGNLVDLTSAGVDSKKIKSYDFYDFEESRVVPYLINKIKKDCQHQKGYYEFMYGKYRDETDIYYTYYSNNEKYLNIFSTRALNFSLRRTNIN